jgi:hypothetical protein
MTGRTFNDFWNHWRALNGLPPRPQRPWPPDDPDDLDSRPSTATRTSGHRKAVAGHSVPLVPAQRPKRKRLDHIVAGPITVNEMPCRCGSTEFIIGPGKGPHVGALRCSCCGKLRRWLGRRELESA